MRLFLDSRVLAAAAELHREQYRTAEPFPHVVLDDVLPVEALDLALDAFPDAESDVWKEYDNPLEGKLEAQGEERLGDDLSLLLYQFNSAPFLRFLERLSGIDALIPDPYFTGGGLHQIPRGGRLGIHADFSRHQSLPLDRRINVLIYLNRDWREEYGGHLELWNRDMTECVVRVAPVFNRMVVFSTTDWAFHGHPDPLTCPPGMTRKSIALYYFSVGRPEGETRPGKQSTLFTPRPEEVLPEGTPLARSREYTGLKVDRFSRLPPRRRLGRAVRRITPPLVYDAVIRARVRRSRDR
jgi:hypothetical protein